MSRKVIITVHQTSYLQAVKQTKNKLEILKTNELHTHRKQNIDNNLFFLSQEIDSIAATDDPCQIAYTFLFHVLAPKRDQIWPKYKKTGQTLDSLDPNERNNQHPC